VQHQPAESLRLLVSVLQRSTSLPVDWVEAREPLRHGRVYVAPPDRHLVVSDDHVLSVKGPRENRVRPAINPLFRTAAAQRGSRVIGVLLTGMLDDGIAGLEAIRRCGGVAVVQDPSEAEYPEMPERAIASVDVDHVVPIAEMGELLGRLVLEEAPAAEIPRDIAIEAQITVAGTLSPADVEAIGEQAPLSCPECSGPLWRVGQGGASTYRCYTGHSLSNQVMLAAQSDEVERALWAAVRALSDRAGVLEKLAEDEERRGRAYNVMYRDRAREARAQAEEARRFLLSLHTKRPLAEEGDSSR
jgi:two-component system, chemotaxis family, protein-glutamate methylesterase/glutaminase